MEAVGRTQPTMVHLLGPLVTKRLETLKFNFLWDTQYQLIEDEISQYKESAIDLLYLAAAQKSVYSRTAEHLFISLFAHSLSV